MCKDHRRLAGKPGYCPSGVGNSVWFQNGLGWSLPLAVIFTPRRVCFGKPIFKKFSLLTRVL